MNLRNFLKIAIRGYRKLLEKSEVKLAPSTPIAPVPSEKLIKEKIMEKPIAIPGETPEERYIIPSGTKVERVVERIIKEPKKVVKIEGIELLSKVPRKIKLVKKVEEKPKIFKTYPLIPSEPKPGEKIFAYVRIYFDEEKHGFVYELVEPKLTDKMMRILKSVKSLLEERLDIDLTKLKKVEATEYLRRQIDQIINYYGFELSEDEEKILRYYIERDFLGFGKIEPLMRDPNIEDISCDGVGMPIYIFHRDPKIGSVPTNILFEDPDELDSFVMRLAQLADKSISVAYPLLDGTLPDGSRVQATLATDIARRGSNFTIRKFTKFPFTPTHLLKFNTINEIALAYLWLAVDYGRSILIAGGTASGKTTFLNVLSLFIRPEKKIISIEDTAELHLPHVHWVPTVARTPIATKPGEIDLFELLRGSFRQRPDYIIVGEVRGKEAYILFQQIATGHPALATIHAENLQKLSDRLTTKPISLPPPLIGSLDIVVFMNRMRYKEKFVRRVNEILEVIGFNVKEGKPIVNRVFKWDPMKDDFLAEKKSYVLKNICKQIGISEEEIKEELERRAFILKWLKEKDITDFRKIHKIFSVYYTFPNKLISRIIGEI